MCGCVPGEVLRQCSAANPVLLSLLARTDFIYSCPIAVCTPMCALYLTPQEYYMVFPALANNASSI